MVRGRDCQLSIQTSRLAIAPFAQQKQSGCQQITCWSSSHSKLWQSTRVLGC